MGSTSSSSVRSTWFWYLGAIASSLGIGGMLLVLAGTFHSKVPTDRGTARQRSAAGLPTAPVTMVTLQRRESAVGTIKPVHEVALASKLLARILELDVKAGQAVTKGQVLARLDDAELQARKKQLEARLAAAKAAAERAQADFERSSKLRQSNVISQAEFEQASATARTTQAEVGAVAQSLVEADVFLGYATLVSPFDGVVVEKRAQSGDTVAPGQVLLNLYDPAHMQLIATVRESLAARLEVGQEVDARLESLDYECRATVSEITPEAQAASRSFQVKVTGPCPPGIYSGLFGRIYIPLDDERVMLVPASAVRRVGQLDLVDVVVEGRLVRRSVRLGREFPEGMEVLAGLSVGEQVVLPKDNDTTSETPRGEARS